MLFGDLKRKVINQHNVGLIKVFYIIVHIIVNTAGHNTLPILMLMTQITFNRRIKNGFKYASCLTLT